MTTIDPSHGYHSYHGCTVYDPPAVDNLLDLVSTELKRVASTHGGEWAGPCPFCGGRDRFRVWPHHPSGRCRFWCRQCQRHGDTLDFLQEQGLSFRESVQLLGGRVADRPPPRPTPAQSGPPAAAWQTQGLNFTNACRDTLWSARGRLALDWLLRRGFTNETILQAGLGFNLVDRRIDDSVWGLDRSKPLWLPKGIVIPWQIGDQLWRINIRRLSGQPKYMGPAGNGNGLYRADTLSMNQPAVLVEGEFDALTVMQETKGAIAAVATGSTYGARRTRWVSRLALCQPVLIAFDADPSGEEAAQYWLKTLPRSKRWRPYWEDINAMHTGGGSVRDWIEAGMDNAQAGT
jgi:DNA primase